MFEQLFDYLFERRRRRLRSDLARRVLGLLEQRGVVLFNANTVEWLGAGHREAFLMVCYLAARERLHLKTDSHNRMIILSNAEFERLIANPPRHPLAVSVAAQGDNFLVATPKHRRKQPRRLACQRVMRVEMTADCIPLDDSGSPPVTRTMRPVVEDAMPEATEKDHPLEAGEWSTVVIAPDEAAETIEIGAIQPETRQSLPDRPREPWFSAEAMLRVVEKNE